MPLTDEQVRACAYQYAGRLMLDPAARTALQSCGQHSAPEFHSKLAAMLNANLQDAPPIDANDAERICRYVSEQGTEFRSALGEAQATVGPYIDGMHVQRP